MRKTLILAFVLLGTVAAPSILVANNNLFLPGDAYFPTVLTKPDIESMLLAKSGTRTFRYSNLEGYDGAFCGYAGYLNATIPAVDDAFARNLERVYAEIRLTEGRILRESTNAGKPELVETNGIRTLFYPAEFTFPAGHDLGLRYNEGWVSEVMKFGHPRSSIRMCTLIPDRNALEREWRDAEVVPALKVSLPDVPLKPVPETTAPVMVEGSVKAIVIGSHSLKELYHLKRHKWLSFTVYVVDSKGITTFVNEEGVWEARTGE